MTHSIRVAIVQRPPVTLDRTATLKRVLEGIDEAAGDGARLVVFPETYVPGYPEYIWRLRPGDPHDYHLSRQIHARLLENAVDLDADDLAPVREAAEGHGMVVMLALTLLERAQWIPGVREKEHWAPRAEVERHVVGHDTSSSTLNCSPSPQAFHPRTAEFVDC